MEIYGFALVGICMFIGSTVGNLLGNLIGLNKDMGGVGFAMLLLIMITNYLKVRGNPISEKTNNGIKLLSALYIPIVVAMSATQDVLTAFSGGTLAFVAGGITTVVCLYLVPLISKLGRED